MSRSTTLHPDSTTVRAWRPRVVHLWWVPAAAVALGVLLWLGPLLSIPPRVDALTFDNPTVYDISVEASDDGGSWTPVGTVRAGETARFDHVRDQGDTWVFRYSSQGRVGGEVERSAEQLEQDDWQVPIPVAVGETLRADGAPEPR